MIEPIKTPRLRLESLSIECLEALVDEDLERARRTLPFRMTYPTSLAGQPWISRRLAMIRETPSHHPWLYRAIVRKEDDEMIGYISCHHGYPDPDLTEYSEHGIELGYTIEALYRRRGYAQESVLALIDWIYKQREEAEVFITISPGNEPSTKMALKLDFRKVGEHMDEIDGLEIVFKHPKEIMPNQ